MNCRNFISVPGYKVSNPVLNGKRPTGTKPGFAIRLAEKQRKASRGNGKGLVCAQMTKNIVSRNRGMGFCSRAEKIKAAGWVQTAKTEPEIAVFQACRKRSEINFAWNYNLLKIRTLTIKFFCRKYSKFLHKKFVIRIFFVPLQSQIRRVYSVKLLTLNGLGVLEKYF